MNTKAAHSDNVLEVRGLTVSFTPQRRVPWRAEPDYIAVNDIDLDVRRGKTLGLVGESGSGKSTTARAILHLLAPSSGEIESAGFKVHKFGKRVPTGYRKAVQAVFQDPMASLDPTKLIKDIIAESLRLHQIVSGRQATEARVNELLKEVGLSRHHGERYSYQLSGGQRQRVSIARAIAVEPDLVVLDEPVSALDVSVQSQVINLLEDLQQSTGMAYLFVAHDLAVVRHSSDEIAVMYRSRIVEVGPADRVCEEPAHPYTGALLSAAPDPDPDRQAEQRARRRELGEVMSTRESSSEAGAGCPFVPRCPHAMSVCAVEFPEWTEVDGGGRVACHLFTKIDAETVLAAQTQKTNQEDVR